MSDRGRIEVGAVGGFLAVGGVTKSNSMGTDMIGRNPTVSLTASRICPNRRELGGNAVDTLLITKTSWARQATRQDERQTGAHQLQRGGFYGRGADRAVWQSHSRCTNQVFEQKFPEEDQIIDVTQTIDSTDPSLQPVSPPLSANFGLITKVAKWRSNQQA
jgi:hypothetical protein